MSTEYKGYQIVNDGTFGYYKVKSVGRGSVPKDLEGYFTTVELAKTSIDTHGKRSEKGVESSGQTESND